MANITALFFDLDGTLHDFKGASDNAMSYVYAKIRDRCNIDVQSLKARYSEIVKLAEDNGFIDGRGSIEYRTERFSQLLSAFGVHDTGFVNELVVTYGEKLEYALKLAPNALSLLEKLSKEYSLYLVTEGPADAQKRAIKILGLQSYFKQIFISGECKKKKEDGALFAHALRETGHSAFDVVVIGDSEKRDLGGANKAGLNAIIINHNNLDELGAKLANICVV